MTGRDAEIDNLIILGQLSGRAREGPVTYNQAIEYHKQELNNARDLGDRAREGSACDNLGKIYYSIGDFQQTIVYERLHLNIAKEMGNKAREQDACHSLGIAHDKLGDFRKAIDYDNSDLQFAKEIGNKAKEEAAYKNLGVAYHRLGNFKQAIQYHMQNLGLVKERKLTTELSGDKAGDFFRTTKEKGRRNLEGDAYYHLDRSYHGLNDFKQAMLYHTLHLCVSKELGNKSKEATAYCNLGIVYHSLGSFKEATEYLPLSQHCQRNG